MDPLLYQKPAYGSIPTRSVHDTKDEEDPMRILSRLQTGAVVAGLAALELQPAAHDEGAL